jgi:hypothetical protein
MRTKPYTARISRLVIFVLLVLASASLPGRATSDSDASFPLNEGTYWIYQGFVRWTHDINRVSKIPVNWKMEVRKVIRRGHLLLALVNGFPADLDWSDGHPNPSDRWIIQSGEDKYYLIASDDLTAATLKRAQDPNDSLDGLLHDDDLFLELPLKKSMKFCDPDGMARPDSRYCWVVDSVAPAALGMIKGISRGQRTAYRVRFVTNPDDIAFTYVPGVGFISYEYHHHGTVADTELKLVEFHMGGDSVARSSRAHP